MSNRRSIVFIVSGGVFGALLTALLFLGIQRCQDTPTRPSHTPASGDTDSTAPEVADAGPSVPNWEILSPNRDMRGNCNICGQIFSADQTPLKNATVKLRLLDEPWESANVEDTAITDEQGHYCINQLTEDAVYQLFAWAEGYAVASYEDVVCGAATDLYLEKGAALELKFVDEQGYSVPYVDVHLAGSSLWPVRRALSDVRGRLKVHGLPEGVYSFSATKDDLSFMVLEPIPLAPGDEIELEAQLKRIAPIEIAVKDAADNAAVANAVVTAVPQNESMLAHTFITDDNGKVTVPTSSIAGTAVTVFAAGFTQKKVDNIHPGAAIEVFLSSGSVIRGKVQTPSGKAVEGAMVEVRMIQGDTFDEIPNGEDRSFILKKARAEKNGLPQALDVDKQIRILGPTHIPLPDEKKPGETLAENDSVQTWMPSNAEGEFVLDAIPAGEISIGAEHPQFVLSRRPTLNVVPGRNYDNIPILMKPGATLSLRIVSALGHPVSDAAITVYDMEGQIIRNADSGTDGYAELEGLPEQFRVQAVATGFIPGAKKIFGASGQQVDAVMKLDDANRTLHGRVVNRLGTGISGVQIEAELLDKGRSQVLTGISDSDGSFSLEGAGDGAYLVRGSIDGEVRATANAASYSTPVNLVIKRGDADTTGITTISPSAVSAPKSQYSPSDFSNPSSSNGGESLGVHPMGGAVAVTSSGGSAPSLREPGTDLNDSFVAGNNSSAYGDVDNLMVTGAPAGIGVIPITLRAKKKQIIVTHVQAGSLVAAAGLKPGATLLKIDSRTVTGVAMANHALQGPIGSVVMIDFMQDDEPLSIVVQRERK